MKYLRQELSGCEELIMTVLWQADDSMTCQEILDQVKEKYGLDYQPTTVYTFLKHLTTKGYVNKLHRGVNLYEARQGREAYLREKVELFAQIWFDGDKDKFRRFLDQEE